MYVNGYSEILFLLELCENYVILSQRIYPFRSDLAIFTARCLFYFTQRSLILLAVDILAHLILYSPFLLFTFERTEIELVTDSIVGTNKFFF